jgi:hypothetical protein
MQELKSVGVLVVESLFRQHSPDFFGGKASRPFNEVIGNFRAAIGQSVEWILRGVVNQVLLGKRKQLG